MTKEGSRKFIQCPALQIAERTEVPNAVCSESGQIIQESCGVFIRGTKCPLVHHTTPYCQIDIRHTVEVTVEKHAGGTVYFHTERKISPRLREKSI